MTDEQSPSSTPETAAGGCALGCGSLFVLAGIAFPLLLVITRTYAPDKLMFPLIIAGPSFLLGHMLAVVAIQSKSTTAQQNGKRALLIIWLGIALFFAIYLFILSPKYSSAK